MPLAPELNRAYAREKYLKWRRRVLEALGGRCCKCGFDDPDSARYYREISENLNGYQLLCANHNWIKRFENNEHNQHRRQPSMKEA